VPHLASRKKSLWYCKAAQWAFCQANLRPDNNPPLPEDILGLVL
jgi:hypothetical protein